MSTTLSYASSLTATRSFGTGLRGTPSRFTRGNATVTNHTTTTLSHPSGATRQQPTITVGSQTESRQPPLSPDVTFRSKASRFTARKVLPASILSETTRSAFTTPSGPVTPPNPKAGHGATNQPTCTSDVTTDQASILQRLESAGIQIPEFADTTEMAMFCADARRKVECAEKVAEEQARFGQMIAEIMEESRQRYLVAEALGLRPAHDPPLERDPRFAEAWNEVVIARRQRDARTASMRDLESASSAVPSQMQSRLPETSKHDQVGLEAEVHTEATIHLDASEKDTMYGSEPSSVPFTYEQPRMGKRRIDMMTAETALAAGAPLSHPSLKVFRTAHDPPRAFRLGTSRPVRRQMAEGMHDLRHTAVAFSERTAEQYTAEVVLAAETPGPTTVEPASKPVAQHSATPTWGRWGSRSRPLNREQGGVSCLSALPSIRDARVSLTGVSNAAAAAWETPVMPQQTSIEDLIAKYRSQPRAFKRARPLARLQPIESATIIDAPAYRSEPPASAPAPVAEDAAAGDVDDAIIVDHTEWDRRFEIAEARRQERQPQAEPGLEPEPEAEDAPGILSKLSSWARSAMAWVKEKVWG
ncbi:hypothetical protein LTR91_019769 [Friedmanniomyces endolithicus]|uniref:Uncharacterized protein n=1 Tax=Friedmanniomyces endolithicus TaxID=329885 RepID=A0AAN6H904_9PEZI|nr:hypothetical protein LTR75_010798 [Friedmanniomyces endolithicus]KAK0836634.1 hypothetical protein LTR03_013485 [Friedmanniomyces endolithicus]KAK0862787.1 hypothetical protein LTS02_007014 [Friedmanniomyces endolithicus]KAK0865445.1 hypothetical protein LTR87_015432 [Friedmanniomyces endolithicus]KAK0891597.1 hypothetical protein LTR02_013915 [Friedmanniomyces endolithicus]